MAQQLTVKQPGPGGVKVPPGGWSVFVPEIPADSGKKRVFVHKALHLFIPLVRKTLEANGLDPSSAEKRIHQHTAARLYREGHREWIAGLVDRKRTLAEHWKGTKAFARVKAREALGRSILTTQAEAERRAGICASGAGGGKPCPMNVFTNETAIDAAENEAMAAMVNGRATSMDDLLGTCNACSCRLTTIVHCMPDILMVDEMTQADLAKHPKLCWKHQLRK